MKERRQEDEERTEQMVVKEVDMQQERELLPTITPINNQRDLSFF
jgi:hypothetical protein